MTEALNQIAGKWFCWEVAMLWQVSVVIAVVAAIDFLIRRWAWPQVRYALWLLVLVKLVLPPTLTSPTSFTAEIPFVAQEAIKIQITRPEPFETTGPVGAVTPAENPQYYTKAPVDAVSADVTAQPREVLPAAATLSWEAYGFIVWLGGIVILASWLIIRLSNLRREHLKNEQQARLPERFEELLAATAQKVKLRKVPQVILTNKVCCPAVFGIFRPVLLMPADKLKHLTRQDAEHILLHELAHIKRGDLFIHAVYMSLQIAYWFNPLLWLIRRQLQNLRELCCDATVAKILREKTFRYRETLLETARQLLAEPVDPGLGLLGLFENSNWLVDRLKWLEKKSWKNRRLRIFTILVIVGVMLVCVLPMTKAEKSQRVPIGIDEKLNISDKAGELVINSLFMEPPDGKNLRGKNSTTLSVGVTNKSQKEIYLGLEYYTDSGTVAKVFSPGASSLTQIRRVAPNYQGQMEFPMRYNRFVKGGYVKITLAKCSDNQLKEAKLAFLPVDSEILHEKKYVIVPREEEKAAPVPKDSLYEKAKASKGFVVRVGPTEFRAHTVVRWERNGSLVIKNPDGSEKRVIGMETPDFSAQTKWMDIAQVYLSPEQTKYDVVELRVFGHQNRKFLGFEDYPGIGYNIDDSVVTVYSTSKMLPDSLDIWMRVLHKPDDKEVYTIAPAKGSIADIDGNTLRVLYISKGINNWKDGKRSRHLSQWDATVTSFEMKFDKPGNKQYQLCAVAKDGRRFVPDFPHFFRPSNGWFKCEIGLPMDQIKHFELRPFKGRDRFYFDDIKLPRRVGRLDTVPMMRFKTNGQGGEHKKQVGSLYDVDLGILPGSVISGVSSGSSKLGNAYIIEKSPENLTTLVCQMTGIGVKGVTFAGYDKGGNRLDLSKTIRGGGTGGINNPLRYISTRIPVEKIHTIDVYFEEDAENIPATINTDSYTQNANFKATLPNGVTVELVGVCGHPSEGKQWWRADGTALTERPYDKTEHAAKLKNRLVREFATRFLYEGEEPIGIKWDAMGGQGNVNDHPLRSGQKVKDMWMSLVDFPKTQDKCTVRVGVANGPWQTRHKANHEELLEQPAEDPLVGTFVLEKSEDENIQVGVRILLDKDEYRDEQWQIVALDTKGKIHKGLTRAHSTGSTTTRTYWGKFRNLRFEDLKEVRLRTRPYQWVRFKNVSLKPNLETDVEVEGNSGWGEAVEGVRCRLRTTKRVWKLGERLTFSLDVRNQGDRPILVDVSGSMPCYEIEYDGRWYGYTGRGIIRGLLYVRDLAPGEEISDAMGVDFPGVWVTPVPSNDGKPQKLLDFSPGTHEVRVRLYPGRETYLGRQTYPGIQTYPGRQTQDRGAGVVSNPVEIEILAWDGTSGNGEAEREKPSVWLTVLPKSPIRSLNEYEHWIRTDPRPTAPLYKPVPVPACDFEIRRASDQQRVARIPLGESFGGTGELTQSVRRRFGWLGNGEYLVALCIGYWRCSNVSRLTLDSDFDGSVAPTLSLVPLEAASGGKLPFLGIRAVGPTPQDAKLMNDTIAFPKLIVDGVERNLKTLKWVGPVAPLESGKIYTRILDLDGYEPAIEPGKEHTVKAIVGKYESASVVIPADNLPGQHWDIATKKLPPVPPPRIALVENEQRLRQAVRNISRFVREKPIRKAKSAGEI